MTTEPAGATDWSYAQINRPLTTGDQLWNDQNARSELHIGSTAVRLGQSTSLDVLNLDDNSAQLKVAQGTLSTRVRELPPGSSYEIDTPNLALGVNGPGDYRVDVAPDGSSTTVTVRSGSATVYGDGGQVPVAAGRQIRFGGTNLQQARRQPARPASTASISGPRAATPRKTARCRRATCRAISPAIRISTPTARGAAARNTAKCGCRARRPPAGRPTTTATGSGRRRGAGPGSTTQPWGFAPYHYGRWAQVDDTWAWVPGPVAADAPPVYAPALVAFVGDDEGGGVAAPTGV